MECRAGPGFSSDSELGGDLEYLLCSGLLGPHGIQPGRVLGTNACCQEEAASMVSNLAVCTGIRGAPIHLLQDVVA